MKVIFCATAAATALHGTLLGAHFLMACMTAVIPQVKWRNAWIFATKKGALHLAHVLPRVTLVVSLMLGLQRASLVTV